MSTTQVFYDSLLLTPRPGEPSELTQHKHRHNLAIVAHQRRRMGATNTARPQEVALLDLMQAIEGALAVYPVDGFSAEYVYGPMFTAFSNLINHDLGRLDGGTLWGWINNTAQKFGMDPETYELTGGES